MVSDEQCSDPLTEYDKTSSTKHENKPLSNELGDEQGHKLPSEHGDELTSEQQDELSF